MNFAPKIWKIKFFETLRRSLENKIGTPIIIFLSDEHSNQPADGYAR
ncbi:MAG TPA: hypothetical protein VK675_02605 [Candidatus Paceibacterota bacterium]|nr:hypothetical protein [Candidatus Paceibacterota bacterium]